MKEKKCASCNGAMDRHSKICRSCYLKAVEKNPEEWRVRHNALCKKWRSENHERSNEIARKSRARWIAANPARAKEVQRFTRERVRRQILSIFGGKCACGFSDWRALQLDHINGGGNRERASNGTPAMSVWQQRAWIEKNPDAARAKFQVLCANCNWIKRHEHGEFGNGKR